MPPVGKETAPSSLTAIRYGRTNSPARPNRVMAVNPITVAENRLRIDGRALSGFRNTAQRKARHIIRAGGGNQSEYNPSPVQAGHAAAARRQSKARGENRHTRPAPTAATTSRPRPISTSDAESNLLESANASPKRERRQYKYLKRTGIREKIEPGGEKASFLHMKETGVMATATLALGVIPKSPTGQDAPPAGGIAGRHVVERILDQDSSLVARCLRGDESAWEDLVRLHSRRSTDCVTASPIAARSRRI
jgi:hypothetical protein